MSDDRVWLPTAGLCAGKKRNGGACFAPPSFLVRGVSFCWRHGPGGRFERATIEDRKVS